MFVSRYLNNALNSVDEQALRLIHNGYKLLSDRILEDNKPKKTLHIKEYRITNNLKFSNSKQVYH